MNADGRASPLCYLPASPAPGKAAPWGITLPFITVSGQSLRAAQAAPVNYQSDTNRWCRQPAGEALGSPVSLTLSRGKDLAGLRVPV